MKALIIIGAAILGILGLLKKFGGAAKEIVSPGEGIVTDRRVTLDDLYERHGRQKGVDPLLLKAIAQVESSENPQAKNPLDPSYGLMQILCVDDGRGGCSNRLNVNDWPPESKERLYDPDYSLHIGSQILAWNMGQYGFRKGIAVYNSWSAHTAPTEGPFPNQAYVNKVIGRYETLKGQAYLE